MDLNLIFQDSRFFNDKCNPAYIFSPFFMLIFKNPKTEGVEGYEI
jgi:hypothetical protein